MDFNDTLITEFINLGSVTRRDAHVALQVYLELSEVKKYWEVDYKYHDELRLLYFTAKKRKSESGSIFVPKSSSDDLNFNQMQNYLTLCLDCDIKSIFLVFVGNDSTCVFYQISDGLIEPSDMTNKHSKQNTQEKLDADIKKHRKVIAEAALCGLSVTIRNSKSE